MTDPTPLLQALSELPTDADLVDHPLRVFLPLPEHARALHERVVVVRGDHHSSELCVSRLV